MVKKEENDDDLCRLSCLLFGLRLFVVVVVGFYSVFLPDHIVSLCWRCVSVVFVCYPSFKSTLSGSMLH